MIEAADSADRLRSEAVEALRLLGLAHDDYDREEYLLSLLKVVFQRGEIAAGDRDIAKNSRTLALIASLTAERDAIRDVTMEECAKVAENYGREIEASKVGSEIHERAATRIAKAIRSLKNTSSVDNREG